MKISSLVENGISYLLHCQREDGGIPSTAPNQPSGSWTTAHTLYACLRLQSCHFPREHDEKLRSMATFVLSTRLTGCGWPMSRSSRISSTLPTGSAVAALSLA